MTKLNLQIDHYVPLVRQILASDNSQYFFTNVLYFQKLLFSGKLADANNIYVSEIIYRLHASSIITMRRNMSWIDAIIISRDHSSYFSFCAALRGLIESAADSFYSLKYVPISIATYFQELKRLLLKKENKKLAMFKELEDWGIHFLEAGKYEKDSKKVKEHYKAMSTWEYLKAIDKESVLKPVYPLYQELCQITHPSRETTYLYFKEENGHWSAKNFNGNEEIENLLKRYDSEFEEVFQKSFNAAMLSLWIIDMLPIKETKCLFIREFNFDEIKEFKKMKKLMKSNKRVNLTGRKARR